MVTTELNVPTVHCTACKLNIEESLEDVAGVATSEVDLDRKSVTVTHDPAEATVDAIIAAVEAAGYPVSA